MRYAQYRNLGGQLSLTMRVGNGNVDAFVVDFDVARKNLGYFFFKFLHFTG